MRLNPAQKHILTALSAGATLKTHRTLDGAKVHLLHPLEGDPEPVAPADVAALKRRGLIASNFKFPAASYLLTEQGAALAATLAEPPADGK